MDKILHAEFEDLCRAYGYSPEGLVKEAVDFAVKEQDKLRSSFICMDCKVDTMSIDEYYMVHDEIWEEAVPEFEGMLCIGCLEERLGRELTPDDFPTDLPVNEMGASIRLKERQGRA